MGFFSEITDAELSRAASEWALEQVKPYGNPKQAAIEFYKLRNEFMETYRVEHNKSK